MDLLLHPSIFLSLTLSGYETQVSPVLHSLSQLGFNFTARFLVIVNDQLISQLSNVSDGRLSFSHSFLTPPLYFPIPPPSLPPGSVSPSQLSVIQETAVN